jgi:hypothetical protein
VLSIQTILQGVIGRSRFATNFVVAKLSIGLSVSGVQQEPNKCLSIENPKRGSGRGKR